MRWQEIHCQVHSDASAQAQHQMQSALLLDVVIAQGAAVLELLAGEDKSLLLGRDALLVLNLRLYVLDRVVGLHVQSDRLAGQSLDEDLHSSAAQAQHQREAESRGLPDLVGDRGGMMYLTIYS